MKRLIFIASALLLSMSTVDASAQSFLKKIGEAAERGVTKGIERQASKTAEKTINNLTSSQPKSTPKAKPQQAQPAQQQVTQPQAQPSHTATAVQSNGEKRYVKNIDLYYKIGDVRGNYKLYYDGSSYYIEIEANKLTKLTPCDGEFLRVKYYFFCVYRDIEFYIKEQLPGAVGKPVVKR